jgi:hypothetical protein
MVVLLVVVVLPDRQTCHAYAGGRAYAVSRANLGRNAALVAARYWQAHCLNHPGGGLTTTVSAPVATLQVAR